MKNLAFFHEGIQRSKSLFQGILPTINMGIKEIDPVGTQSFKTLFDFPPDCFLREPRPSGLRGIETRLGCNKHPVPVSTGLHPFPKQRFTLSALSVGVPQGVVIGGIEKAAAGGNLAIQESK